MSQENGRSQAVTCRVTGQRPS